MGCCGSKSDTIVPSDSVSKSKSEVDNYARAHKYSIESDVNMKNIDADNNKENFNDNNNNDNNNENIDDNIQIIEKVVVKELDKYILRYPSNISPIILFLLKSLMKTYANKPYEMISVDNNMNMNNNNKKKSKENDDGEELIIDPQLTYTHDITLVGVTSIAYTLNHHITLESEDQLWSFMLSKFIPFILNEYIHHIYNANIRHWTVYVEIIVRVEKTLHNLLMVLRNLLKDSHNNNKNSPANLLVYFTLEYLKTMHNIWDPLEATWLQLLPNEWVNKMKDMIDNDHQVIILEPNNIKPPFDYQPILYLTDTPGCQVIKKFCRIHHIPAFIMAPTNDMLLLSLPKLILNDYELSGEIAILQFLAIKINSVLLGDRLKVDELLTWLHSKLAPSFNKTDTDTTHKLIKQRRVDLQISLFNVIAESFLKEEQPYLCGQELTLADMYFYAICQTLDQTIEWNPIVVQYHKRLSETL